jgi:hypothetical protein
MEEMKWFSSAIAMLGLLDANNLGFYIIVWLESAKLLLLCTITTSEVLRCS